MAAREHTSVDAQLSRLKSLYGVISNMELAKKLGKSQSAISGAKMRGQIPPLWLVKAVNTFGVTLQWLSTGEGPMRLGESGGESSQGSRKGEGDILYVPVVEAVLAAGLDGFEVSGANEPPYAFQADFLRRKGDPARMALMRVAGNSMEPVIRSGDMVLIDQSRTTLTPGNPYAVSVEEMVFIRLASAMPGKIILHSMNRELHPSLEVDTRGNARSSVRVLGRCVWACRDL